MTRATPILTNFTAGELSPRLDGRVDLARYHNGCRRLENMIPLAHGPAERRPGTRFIAEVKTSAKKARLVPFEFSTEQAYVIEAGDLYFRFYKDKGRIESPPGTPVEIATPYGEADLAGLKWAQSADVMYLVHPGFAPRKLSRTSHTAWTLTTVDFVDGPYLDENVDAAMTLQPSAATGAGITITAVGHAPFAATDVGRLVRIGHSVNAWVASSAGYTVGGFWHHNGNVYRCVKAGTSGQTGPTGTGNGIADGTVVWDYANSGGLRWGWARVTGYTSATQVTVDVKGDFGGTTATSFWRLGLWSDTTGWPAAVTFHEERLWFGGARVRPQRLDASKSGDFESFAPGANDDDALAYNIASDQVNAIRWLASSRVLLVGTLGAEFRVGADSVGAPLTPVNVTVKRETKHGCADLPPQPVSNSVLFLQRQGRRLRELAFSFESDAYVAPDMTLLADHVTQGGLVDIAYQQEPWSVLWAARADGMLLGFTYLREQQVTAWARHPLADGGKAEAVAVIPGDGADQLWLVAQRTVNGSPKRFVELLEQPLADDADQADAFYVDCGLSYDGAPVATLSGLDHLEGKTVQVLADGAVHPPRTVAGGAITLDWPAAKVRAGLGYVSRLQPMRLEAGAAEGTAQGKKKRIDRVTVRMFRSLGCRLGRDEDHLDDIPFRATGDDMDSAPPLFSGDKDIVFRGTYDGDGSLLIGQDQPLPLTVVCLIPRVATHES